MKTYKAGNQTDTQPASSRPHKSQPVTFFGGKIPVIANMCTAKNPISSCICYTFAFFCLRYRYRMIKGKK